MLWCLVCSERCIRDRASRIALNKVKDLGGDGGVIVLDKNGDVSMDFNTAGMYRAYINNEGDLTVKIYND